MLLPFLGDNKWPSSGSSHSHRTLWQRKRLHDKLWQGEGPLNGQEDKIPRVGYLQVERLRKRAGIMSRIVEVRSPEGGVVM